MRAWPFNGPCAKATGGEPPKDEIFKAPNFENSVSGKPSAVQCRKDLPGDIYLSAQMKRRCSGESDQQVIISRPRRQVRQPGPHDSERPQEVVVQRG